MVPLACLCFKNNIVAASLLGRWAWANYFWSKPFFFLFVRFNIWTKSHWSIRLSTKSLFVTIDQQTSSSSTQTDCKGKVVNYNHSSYQKNTTNIESHVISWRSIFCRWSWNTVRAHGNNFIILLTDETIAPPYAIITLLATILHSWFLFYFHSISSGAKFYSLLLNKLFLTLNKQNVQVTALI